MISQILTDRFLKSLDKIEKGSIRVSMPNGKTYNFEGKERGPQADLELRDTRVISNMVLKGNVAFADDYRNAHWHTSDLTSLLSLAVENTKSLQKFISGHVAMRLQDWAAYMLRDNSLSGSRKNIHDHYDLGNDFYKLWLDETMTYSSAIYNSPEVTLANAQTQKYDRLLDGLDRSSGSLLEIGCGWGGFAERALGRGDFKIKGLTLSEEQHAYCHQKLGNRSDIALQDYRHEQGTFDTIVSIEMFEAVGERYWNTYFSKIASCLEKNGKAMIQTITIRDDLYREYKNGTDFIRSYIFPGGMLPSLEKFKIRAKKAGLQVTDIFHFGQDYARTLQEWLARFDSQIDAVKNLGFDDAFIRMWRFYLAGCIAGFTSGQLNVVQVQLAHA